jgi:hypothetical protein
MKRRKNRKPDPALAFQHLTAALESLDKATRYAPHSWGLDYAASQLYNVWAEAQEHGAGKPRRNSPGSLQVNVIKGGPSTYKFDVSGKVGRIEVKGRSLSYTVGLDRAPAITKAYRIVRVFRADGSGRDVPYGALKKVREAVAAEIAKLERNRR